jgi:diaminopimelate epimerase
MNMNRSAFLRGACSTDGALELPFIKMHGLENAFVIMDGREQRLLLTSADIRHICDMRVGIGAEQLLVIEAPTASGRAEGADAFMRIFNIDGREVAACGNATRCVADLLMDEMNAHAVRIETAAGILSCRKAGPMAVSVDLGPISLDWRQIPLSQPADTLGLPMISGPLANGVAVNVGNPHAVFFVTSLADLDLAVYAPAIQDHPLFPEGANVGAAEIVDERTVRLVVWERPGILTRACGTGACAAVFAARSRKLITAQCVTVLLPGGTMTIEIDGDMATMTGPIAHCCSGRVSV